MTTKQNVRGGWSGVATGVQRSRVPLVMFGTSKKIIIHITKHSLIIDKINELETKYQI